MSNQASGDFVHHTVTANGIRQHYVEAGSGPPLVLLHGFPLFWFQWRKMIPVLAQRFRVIAPDLRGYSSTEKPAGGYDKRTMANDIRALMETGSASLLSNDAAHSPFTLALSGTVTADLPPTVRITAPQDGTSVVVGSHVPLMATAGDDGMVEWVGFFASDAFGGTYSLGTGLADGNGDYALDLDTSNLPPGVYLLQAQAYDDVNQSTTSGPVTLTPVTLGLLPLRSASLPPPAAPAREQFNECLWHLPLPAPTILSSPSAFRNDLQVLPTPFLCSRLLLRFHSLQHAFAKEYPISLGLSSRITTA